jgi:hypothetical protein
MPKSEFRERVFSCFCIIVIAKRQSVRARDGKEQELTLPLGLWFAQSLGGFDLHRVKLANVRAVLIPVCFVGCNRFNFFATKPVAVVLAMKRFVFLAPRGYGRRSNPGLGCGRGLDLRIATKNFLSWKLPPPRQPDVSLHSSHPPIQHTINLPTLLSAETRLFFLQFHSLSIILFSKNPLLPLDFLLGSVIV